MRPMMPTMDVSWLPLIPGLVIAVTAMVVLVADLFMEGPDREGLGWLGMIGLGIAGIAAALLWSSNATGFGGSFVLDRFAVFFTVVLCVIGILTLLMSMDYLGSIRVESGEYYVQFLLAVLGMVVMAQANDLIILFLGLELMSISVYVLAGIWRPELRSSEAALKYFLLGAFASGFLLFGIAMAYGAFGTVLLDPIASQLLHLSAEQRPLALAAVALLLIGFGFKVAAVPFHSWAPDVYEGAPTSVTALMAVGVKAAAFAGLARVFLHALGPLSVDWAAVVWLLAVLSMTIGNLAAIAQRNVKRMLAYSSIAHAGYLLVGLTAADTQGVGAVLFALMGYAMMTLGAFAVVIAVGRRGEPNEEIGDYAGLGFRYPFLGFCMTVFMLSLGGIPLFAGFTSKFFLFSAAIERGYVWLVVIAALNSVVSIYYYMAVLVQMYMGEGGREVQGVAQRPYLTATLLVTSVMTIALGIFPGWLLRLATEAVRSLSA
ncbi:NADH-quinone oxidoreductase subunit N [bacterium]|nr:NADH-quinone oxidoreductase subunit N [bacterium]